MTVSRFHGHGLSFLVRFRQSKSNLSNWCYEVSPLDNSRRPRKIRGPKPSVNLDFSLGLVGETVAEKIFASVFSGCVSLNRAAVTALL